MHVEFVERKDAPDRLVCEAEIYFDSDGPLSGMRFVGFSLWRGADGEVYVTFPSRAFRVGSERRFYDFLRPKFGGDAAGSKAVKDWILAEWRKQTAAKGQEQ